MHTNKEISDIYARNAHTVFRLCCSFMKNKADAEDMLQETFMHLISSGVTFSSAGHEKAWLIVTASNLCKNALRSRKRTKLLPEPDVNQGLQDSGICYENGPDIVTEAVMRLPDAYKTVVYMYYYEEYSIKEIARYMKKTVSAVKMQLLRARAILKEMLGEDYE